MSASKKKLIIDGQIFQTEARDRGMGRYSARFLYALANHKHDYDQIEVVLNKNLELSEASWQAIAGSLKNVTVKKIDLLTTRDHKIEKSFAHNQSKLDTYINSQIAKGFKVHYLILSLFQEPTVAVFPARVRKLLLFYDLIPYLYHQRYQSVMPFENYLKRFKCIYEADQIFTISQTVADDLHVYLGIPKNRLVRIDGAAIRSTETPVKPAMDLPKKFILMPTSDDPRKNNLQAVLGFEEFRAVHDANCRLVITSKIKEKERDYLQSFSQHLIFTGSLPEKQLDWLYENCASILFVPEYEGLGLPILEAVEVNKNIACSSIGAFKEISQDTFFYCDAENSDNISEAILNSVTAKSPSQQTYKKIKEYYTWPKTAERFLTAVSDYKAPASSHKPRLAIFTPVQSGLSAIGKVVAETHAAMSEHFEVDYYVDGGLAAAEVRPNFLQYVASVKAAEDFGVMPYTTYDDVIYHIGNGDYHLESIKNALYLPGYAIPHDTNIREAYRVLRETNMMPKERAELEGKLDEDNGESHHLASVISRQMGVMTHSKYAAEAVKKLGPNMPIQLANLPTGAPALNPAKANDKIVIGLAGIIADIKGIDVIESLAKDPSFAHCSFKLFGFSHVSEDVVARLNSYDNVSVTTNLTDFEFQNNLNKLNVFVNYRLGYQGETSLSTIEAMRSGVAVIVRDTGWYSELPDDTVVKVKEADHVTEALQGLINNPDKPRLIGDNAKKHIMRNFGRDQYVLSLKSLLDKGKEQKGLNQRIATGLKKGGIKSKRDYIKFLEENR